MILAFDVFMFQLYSRKKEMENYPGIYHEFIYYTKRLKQNKKKSDDLHLDNVLSHGYGLEILKEK